MSRLDDSIVNEFVATGSTYVNEFGNADDWVELYNTGTDSINFATTNYYITDDSTKPDKFVINALGIGPGKYLVVSCDDSNRIVTQVHTNFGLSKTGEFIGLYKKDSHGNFVTLTNHPFGAQSSGSSEGRLPNAGPTWSTMSPSPGAANHL